MKEFIECEVYRYRTSPDGVRNCTQSSPLYFVMVRMRYGCSGFDSPPYVCGNALYSHIDLWDVNLTSIGSFIAALLCQFRPRTRWCLLCGGGYRLRYLLVLGVYRLRRYWLFDMVLLGSVVYLG